MRGAGSGKAGIANQRSKARRPSVQRRRGERLAGALPRPKTPLFFFPTLYRSFPP